MIEPLDRSMPDAPGAKANSKAAKARQNPEVGLCTSTLHPAGRSYGNPDPEFILK